MDRNDNGNDSVAYQYSGIEYLDDGFSEKWKQTKQKHIFVIKYLGLVTYIYDDNGLCHHWLLTDSTIPLLIDQPSGGELARGRWPHLQALHIDLNWQLSYCTNHEANRDVNIVTLTSQNGSLTHCFYAS